MFKKILIANRGEIACRVMKTAKAMNIATVAVYSDADRLAKHVAMADEAIRLGPAPSAESYLRADAVIEAARATGAEAIHPGYGFLSENADFARALNEAGITFIGPGVKAITSMGDKITSKNIAQAAGVNVIPGFTDVIRDADHAVEIANDIGYPVMLKASAGGGGKGMRVVWDEAQCRSGFERASNEAQSSFGDGRVFAEKFIQEPRHIEIQVLADGHGNAVYLGERECSIQRRHQKVIEEAPSPFIDPATRKAMGDQAVALAKAVDYQSAGTVEFIVDKDRNFYFLEMNTRLQVEHPVTELVTGLDLVELMIKIAAGESIPFNQEGVTLTGWSLETRVYAEDPLRDFMPSTGRLVRYAEPSQVEGVRVDTGVTEGGEVSMFYDPMIAKLITYGSDRNEAIDRMSEALDRYVIRGVNHNIEFLNALIEHERFRAGNLTTHFIEEEYPEGFQGNELDATSKSAFVIAAAVVHRIHMDRAANLSGQLESHERKVRDDWVVIAEGEQHRVLVNPAEKGWHVELDGTRHVVSLDMRFGDHLLLATIDGAARAFQLDHEGVRYRLSGGGCSVVALVATPVAAGLLELMPEKLPPDLSKFLLSPMPGLLVKLNVKPGDKVKAGEEIAVVEAMKMENSLQASQDQVVKAVVADTGDSLLVDQAIVEFE